MEPILSKLLFSCLSLAVWLSGSDEMTFVLRMYSIIVMTIFAISRVFSLVDLLLRDRFSLSRDVCLSVFLLALKGNFAATD